MEEEKKELTKRKRGIGLSSAAASLAEEALASSGEETGLHGQQQQHVVRYVAAREAVASPDSLLPPRGRERWKGEETKKKSGLIFFSRRKKKNHCFDSPFGSWLFLFLATRLPSPNRIAIPQWYHKLPLVNRHRKTRER